MATAAVRGRGNAAHGGGGDRVVETGEEVEAGEVQLGCLERELPGGGVSVGVRPSAQRASRAAPSGQEP
ncbi:hypothetical protein ACFYN0_23355 [Streptomyces sp. NPDC006704]|uniref:hypothetical protein n=1 Tax=Streptomyces sp. NPDC006704 TaxID=3364760 RepID=UPI003696ED88